MRQAVPDAIYSVMPNAGWPEQVGGRIMYHATPEYFGEYALAFCETGASLIGGCCGTTPKHIEAMALALQSNPHPCVTDNILIISNNHQEVSAQPDHPTQLAQKLAQGQFVIAVEMDPPRGFSTHKLLAGASCWRKPAPTSLT